MDVRVLPAAGRVGERVEYPRWRQTAHLGVGGHAKAELDLVAAGPPLRLLPAQFVVAEELAGPRRGGLVVTRVVGEAGDGRVRKILVPDPVALAQLKWVHAEFARELVHDALDRERGLGATGPAVCVGRCLGGEHTG